MMETIKKELGCYRNLIPDINERTTQIFKAVQGIEICVAESLLKECSRLLSYQKSEITLDDLETRKEVCES